MSLSLVVLVQFSISTNSVRSKKKIKTVMRFNAILLFIGVLHPVVYPLYFPFVSLILIRFKMSF